MSHFDTTESLQIACLLSHNVSHYSFCKLHSAESGLVNVARYTAATHSTSSPLGDATRAVDGGTSAIWWHGSCSFTSHEENPWWRVDLFLVHDVWHVTVTHFEICK